MPPPTPETLDAFEQNDLGVLLGFSSTTNKSTMPLSSSPPPPSPSSSTNDTTSTSGFSIRNIAIGLLGFVLNVTALVLIITTTNIRTPAKVTIISLIISDLTFMTGLTFYDLSQMLLSRSDRPEICLIFIFMIFLSTIVSMLMTAVLSLYNFVAVFFPFAFRNITVRTAIVICLSSWTVLGVVCFISLDRDIAYQFQAPCVPAASLTGFRMTGWGFVACFTTVIVVCANASIIWKFRKIFTKALKSRNRKNDDNDADSEKGESAEIPPRLRSRNEATRAPGERGNGGGLVVTRVKIRVDEVKSKQKRLFKRSYHGRENAHSSEARKTASSYVKKNSSRYNLSEIRKRASKVDHMDLAAQDPNYRDTLLSTFLVRSVSEPVLSSYAHKTNKETSILAQVADDPSTPVVSTLSIDEIRSATLSSLVESSLTPAHSTDVSGTGSGTGTTGTSSDEPPLCRLQLKHDVRSTTPIQVVRQTQPERRRLRRSSMGPLSAANLTVPSSASTAVAVDIRSSSRSGRVNHNALRLWNNTVTLILLSLWCCLLSAPFTVYALWLSNHEPDEIKGLALRPVGVFSSTLLGINSLGNPFLYAWRFINWPSVRIQLRKMCPC